MIDRDLIVLRREVANMVSIIARDAKEKGEPTVQYAANRMWHEQREKLRDFDKAAADRQEADGARLSPTGESEPNNAGEQARAPRI